MGESIIVFKLIGAASTLGAGAVIWAILGRIRPREQLAGTALFLWNPVILVEITGEPAFDAIAALAVAAAIVVAGIRILSRSGRVLVDESPPAHELDRIEEAIASERAHHPEIAGYHKLRARRGGAKRYIDFHLQFHSGTTLEAAEAIWSKSSGMTGSGSRFMPSASSVEDSCGRRRPTVSLRSRRPSLATCSKASTGEIP